MYEAAINILKNAENTANILPTVKALKEIYKPTGGSRKPRLTAGRSVSMVRLRTKATEFSFYRPTVDLK
jgi:hypothetical protein